jgi:hypothetical protein
METVKPEVVDDGSKRDRKGRRIMPAERIDALVREYHASGMTQAAFARRAGLKYPTFAGWVHARRGSRVGPDGVVRFAELQLPAGAAVDSELSVSLPDGAVVRGRDAALVAALVRALRS